MKGFDLITPGWGRPELTTETTRVYEICDGCRRCFNLCPSFNTLFDRIDEHEGDISKLASADSGRIADECYYCKLCFNHCPYTPPHQYEIDFPRLMLAWKKLKAGERGVQLRDRLLAKTDLIGRVGTALAPLANWTLRTGWVRSLLHQFLGVHQNRLVLPFQTQRFAGWWKKRRAEKKETRTNRKVALFASCLVSYQATDVGKAAVQVLEKNGIEVVVPEQQCCGMPSYDIGDTDAIIAGAQANIRSFQPWLEAGYEIVVPVPSCSLMIKREYPYVVPGADAARLSERTFDICEYLMQLNKEGQLCKEFVNDPGRVAYQAPCHLRDQNIGFKSKELMELAGAQVELIERCSGHDGAWSAKVEFFDLSMKVAGKAVRAIENASMELVASDCPLAALQLDQAGGWNRPARHPIQIVRDAYGIST